MIQILMLLVIGALPFTAEAQENALKFNSLKSKYSTVLECQFDSGLGEPEKFAGKLRLTSKGELFLVVSRNADAANECRLDLRSVDLGDKSASGDTVVQGARKIACEPLLTPEMRRRLNDTMELVVPLGYKGLSSKRRKPEISAIHMRGVFPCLMSTYDRKALELLGGRLATGKIKYGQNVQSAEPLDTSGNGASLKRKTNSTD